MRLICIALMAILFHACQRKAVVQSSAFLPVYTDTHGNPMLLGIHKKEDLQKSPYHDWFDKNYDGYKIDSLTAIQLKPFVKNKQFEIFMGTWCGDSKREVPRMYKLLEYAGVAPSQIKLIMVDNHDSTYKQSPGHEEKDKNILRVPDLLVYDGKKEINRIVEYPVASLEKDLLDIVKGESYQPNYKGAAYLMQLAATNNTIDIIKDSSATIEKLKQLVHNSSEINSLGYTWMAAKEMNKAMMAFTLNAALFPGDPNVYDSLGEINLKLNKKDMARKYYQQVLIMQPANENAKKMLSGL